MRSDCIFWTGGVSQGYGQSRWNGKTERAHRVAWRQAGRDIPEGMHVHHLCENRLCINVDHLELIDPHFHGWLHNQRRGSTHCPQGHEYTPENTIIRRGRHRECRECDRQRRREYYQRNREAMIAKSVAYKRRRHAETRNA
jgi:hypothetical protein